MTPALFMQGPGVYIPVLLLSIVITIIVYALFPMIFARVRKKPITAKKYKWLCFGVNALMSLLFIAFKESPSVSPYLIWTLVFSSLGVKVLNRRSIITDQKHVDDDNKKSDLTISSSNGPAYAIGIYAPPEVSSTGSVTHKRKSKVRYCKHCGGRIDYSTKACSNCRKRYFYLRFSKSQIPTLIIGIVAICCIAFCLKQNENLQQENIALNSNLSDLSAIIEQLNATIDSQETTIEQLNAQITEHDKTRERLIGRINELSDIAYLIDEDIARDLVFVLNSDATHYHKSKCIIFQAHSEYLSGSFCAYLTEDAIAKGCRPGKCCF